MTKKITKKDMFNALLSKYNLTDDEVAFINHEIELLDKKNASRSGDKALTKTQKENEVLKQQILANMVKDKEYTITDMLKSFDCFDENTTNQKVSALVNQLRKLDNAPIDRKEVKGKSYFVKVVD